MSRRAISIRQPWVEMILQGIKRFEFRSVPTNIRGRVYVYASSRVNEHEEWAWRKIRKSPDGVPTGRIVGTVEVVGCRWDERKGCYAYALKRPRRLRRPRIAKNQPNPIWWIPEF